MKCTEFLKSITLASTIFITTHSSVYAQSAGEHDASGISSRNILWVILFLCIGMLAYLVMPDLQKLLQKRGKSLTPAGNMDAISLYSNDSNRDNSITIPKVEPKIRAPHPIENVDTDDPTESTTNPEAGNPYEYDERDRTILPATTSGVTVVDGEKTLLPDEDAGIVARLIRIREDGQQGSTINIMQCHRDVTIQIGRHVTNDIRINVPSVSNEHAILIQRGSSHLLQDMNSSGGTYLKGVEIAAQQAKPLSHGDIIKFGPEVTYEFRVQNQDDETAYPETDNL